MSGYLKATQASVPTNGLVVFALGIQAPPSLPLPPPPRPATCRLSGVSGGAAGAAAGGGGGFGIELRMAVSDAVAGRGRVKIPAVRAVCGLSLCSCAVQ